MRRTKYLASVALAMLFGSLGSARAETETPPNEAKTARIFVANTGSDDNAGTEEKPLATLHRAQELARKTAATVEPLTIVEIILRGGNYRLAAPLVLTPDDLSKAAGIFYRGAEKEKVVLSGGEEIRGWKAVGEVWQTEVPDVKSGKWRFVDLYVGDERRPRARTPNADYFLIERAGDDKRTSFFFRPGDVKAWANPGEAEVVFLHDWSTSRIRVKQIDEAARKLAFTDPIGPSAPHYAIDAFEPHPRYFLEGAREFLDAPGEWHLHTTTGVLTYKPRPGEVIDGFVAVAPRLENLLTVHGDATRRIESVGFINLTFAHCGWLPPEQGYAGYQAGFCEARGTAQPLPTRANAAAAIKVDHAKRVVFRDCHLLHHGGSGIWIERNCDTCVILHCTIDDIGGNGIMVGEITSREKGDVTQYVVVSQSTVRRCGQRYLGAVGVWLGLVANCAVEQCEISNMPYTGISLGWKWDESPTSCRENTIFQNDIHQCLLTLSDGGGIYTLGRQPGTVIAENHIHDIPANAGRAESNGMFLDEGSSEFTVEGNTVYNIAKSPIRFHKAGRLTLKNNRLISVPGVPTFRYNNANASTMKFETNKEIVTEKYELPAGDPARKAGPSSDFSPNDILK